MIEELNKILEEKNITHKDIKKGIIAYFVRHDELFKDIIPTEELIERLKENLDSVVLVNPEGDDRPKDCVFGQYYGFDEKRIELLFKEEYLEDEKLYEDFLDILFHELTHCLYRTKDKILPWKENHIFTSYEKLEGMDIIVSGENKYTEPIVNYISSIISGHVNSSYIRQTAAIRDLATVVGVKELILISYEMDLEKFKLLFKDMPEGSYEKFTNGLSLLGDDNLSSIGKRMISEFFNDIESNKKKI